MSLVESQYSRTLANSSRSRGPLLWTLDLELSVSDDDPSEFGLALRPRVGAGGGGVVESARRRARQEAEGRNPRVAG